MELHHIPLILMYILGVMGIYTTVNFFYRWLRYGENHIARLYQYPSIEEMSDKSAGQIAGYALSMLVKQILAAEMIMIVGFCVFIVLLDSLLWLNRKLDLGLSSLANWYGPNMGILRLLNELKNM